MKSNQKTSALRPLFTRRDFTAAIGTSVGLAALGTLRAQAATYDSYVKPEQSQGAHSFCPGCRSHCAFTAYTANGQVTRMVANGTTLCQTGYALGREPGSSTRVLSPLKKGEDGAFAEIPWDSALSDFATAASGKSIAAITNRNRPNSWYLQALAQALGASAIASIDSFGGEARRAGVAAVLEADDIMPDTAPSQLVIVVDGSAGKTDAAERIAHLARSRAAGGTTVLIDPVMPASASHYDEWLQPAPGTEGAILMAVANRLYHDGAFDEAALAALDPNYRTWLDTLDPFTPQWAERTTGVSAARIVSLAARITQASPAVAFDIAGVGATGCIFASSAQTAAAACAVAALAGALQTPGGTQVIRAINWGIEGIPAIDANASLADIVQGDASADLILVDDIDLASGHLGAAVLDKATVKVAFATTLTPTAALCDYVFPVASTLESNQLPAVIPAAAPVLVAGQAVAEPPEGVPTMQECCNRLAEACGCAEKAAVDTDAVSTAWLKPFSLSASELAASGRIELSVPTGAPLKVSLAAATWSSPASSGADGELFLMSGYAPFVPDAMLAENASGTRLHMHPQTAEKAGIRNGDIATVSTRFADLTLPALVTERVHPRALYVPLTVNGDISLDVLGSNEAQIAADGNAPAPQETLASIKKAGA